MTTVAHPGWLWGLAALALPVALHLWRRRPSRRVAVSGVRFVEAARATWARGAGLRDPWLLLLRLLVLTAAVAALAGPRGATAPGARDLVLAWPPLLDGIVVPVLDSLRGAGADVAPLDPADRPWEAVAAAAAAYPDLRALHVVAPTRVAGALPDRRPTVAIPVVWHAVPGVLGGRMAPDPAVGMPGSVTLRLVGADAATVRDARAAVQASGETLMADAVAQVTAWRVEAAPIGVDASAGGPDVSALITVRGLRLSHDRRDGGERWTLAPAGATAWSALTADGALVEAIGRIATVTVGLDRAVPDARLSPRQLAPRLDAAAMGAADGWRRPLLLLAALLLLLERWWMRHAERRGRRAPA